MIWILASILITIAGLNHFKNILLSSITMGKLTERMCEIRYKQASFIYLIFIAIGIFFCNELTIGQIPFSLIVLLFHLGYMTVLLWINPYQKSLRIHSFGLALNHFTYLFFLFFVNVTNFVDLSDIISLIFVYAILFFCVVLIVFTIIRLYYEYRYG